MKSVRRSRPLRWLLSRGILRKHTSTTTTTKAVDVDTCPKALFKRTLAADADDGWCFGAGACRNAGDAAPAVSLDLIDNDDASLASDDGAGDDHGSTGIITDVTPESGAAATERATAGAPGFNTGADDGSVSELGCAETVDVVYGFVDMARGEHSTHELEQWPPSAASRRIPGSISTTRSGSRLNPLMFHSSNDGGEVFMVDINTPPASPAPPAYDCGSYFVFESTKAESDDTDIAEGGITSWGWPPSEPPSPAPMPAASSELAGFGAIRERTELDCWC